MARHRTDDPRVLRATRALADLYLGLGSVRAVHRTLSDALDQGDGAPTLHLNRVVALLAADPGRSVNTATLDAVEQALDQVAPLDAPGEADGCRAEILRAGDGGADVKEVAERTGHPEGVIRYVLDAAHPRRAAPPERGARSTPDWSFQDDAVEATLRRLDEAPDRRVGLVIPTGGGKTRIAVRTLLAWLARHTRPNGVVVWVTHRSHLREQARRELLRATRDGTPDLPPDAARLLRERVVFTQLSRLSRVLDEYADRVALVVVDEAHHAAAPSYLPVFEQAPCPALLLTATPVRADGRPIGIDVVAYTTTYRDLFRRGVIVEPTFDDPIVQPEWRRPRAVRALADYILDRTETDIQKALVVVSRKEHAPALYDALAHALADRPAHALDASDLAYVHGAGSSLGSPASDALDEVASWPRGILVATGQLVGEGFDDPLLDGVVVTYPSTSVAHLMQLAGRALRWAPGKTAAHVVQARESPIGYHFEQRWLYQDLSDRLRPRLDDRTYATTASLQADIEALLDSHNVAAPLRRAALDALSAVQPGDPVRMLLSGLPYYGPAERFDADARWNAVLATPDSWGRLMAVFNDFSARGADVDDLPTFLRAYLQPSAEPGGAWKTYVDLLAAMSFARREITGQATAGSAGRGYGEHPYLGTTWLTYVSYTYAPALPQALDAFLGDAANKTAVAAEYLDEPEAWALAVKLPLPLGGTWAYLLDPDQTVWLHAQRDALARLLRDADPSDAFGTIDLWRNRLASVPVPFALAHRLDRLVAADAFGALSLDLTWR